MKNLYVPSYSRQMDMYIILVPDGHTQARGNYYLWII
jgi:hypothetical protein